VDIAGGFSSGHPQSEGQSAKRKSLKRNCRWCKGRIGPSDFEKSIGKARLLVGSRVEYRPVYLVELRQTPVVDTTQMLDLGLLVRVLGEGGAADMTQLGW
jgi:hypothetical protein